MRIGTVCPTQKGGHCSFKVTQGLHWKLPGPGQCEIFSSQGIKCVEVPYHLLGTESGTLPCLGLVRDQQLIHTTS